jgi:hypothetical protein
MAIDNNEAFPLPFDSSLREASVQFSWKLPLSIVIFVLCISPTLVSYTPYSFRWDDSDYLWRSIAVSRAFWTGNSHDLRAAMVSIRPPIMTFLGLPWGPLTSWDGAGKCFITITALTALFVACCLFLLLRVGIKLRYLVIAGVCAFAALGPYFASADARMFPTGFMADSLFAWIALAATLLIPHETATRRSSTTESIARGVLWATIFLAGAMTKVSFLYFIVLVLPIVFFIRMRRSGFSNAFVALISLGVCSLPVAIYYLRYGQIALKNGFAASFGHDAPLYYVSLSQFLTDTVRDSPGILLSVTLTVAGLVYLLIKHRDAAWSINALALLIMLGYCATTLASSNRDIRYSFSAFIAIPFLIAILLSRDAYVSSQRHAIISAVFVFCCLVAAGVPMLHRPNRQSIHLAEVALAQAADSNAKRVLLATDSSTLNNSLMSVAIVVSASPAQVEAETLAWRAASGVPAEADVPDIRESDLVVFQNSEALDSPITNQRVSKYEQYARQRFGDAPIKVIDGLRIYGKSQIDPRKP